MAARASPPTPPYHSMHKIERVAYFCCVPLVFRVGEESDRVQTGCGHEWDRMWTGLDDRIPPGFGQGLDMIGDRTGTGFGQGFGYDWGQDWTGLGKVWIRLGTGLGQDTDRFWT
jgi:hypothetical protein